MATCTVQYKLRDAIFELLKISVLRRGKLAKVQNFKEKSTLSFCDFLEKLQVVSIEKYCAIT